MAPSILQVVRSSLTLLPRVRASACGGLAARLWVIDPNNSSLLKPQRLNRVKP